MLSHFPIGLQLYDESPSIPSSTPSNHQYHILATSQTHILTDTLEMSLCRRSPPPFPPHSLARTHTYSLAFTLSWLLSLTHTARLHTRIWHIDALVCMLLIQAGQSHNSQWSCAHCFMGDVYPNQQELRPRLASSHLTKCARAHHSIVPHRATRRCHRVTHFQPVSNMNEYFFAMSNIDTTFTSDHPAGKSNRIIIQ